MDLADHVLGRLLSGPAISCVGHGYAGFGLAGHGLARPSAVPDMCWAGHVLVRGWSGRPLTLATTGWAGNGLRWRWVELSM
jgi:hypothetical protein